MKKLGIKEFFTCGTKLLIEWVVKVEVAGSVLREDVVVGLSGENGLAEHPLAISETFKFKAKTFLLTRCER